MDDLLVMSCVGCLVTSFSFLKTFLIENCLEPWPLVSVIQGERTGRNVDHLDSGKHSPFAEGQVWLIPCSSAFFRSLLEYLLEPFAFDKTIEMEALLKPFWSFWTWRRNRNQGNPSPGLFIFDQEDSGTFQLHSHYSQVYGQNWTLK
jgi:hypothetical protein